MSADITDYDLLVAVRDRIIAKCDFTQVQCIICDDVVPIVFPPSERLCTVSMGECSFDPNLYSGGGNIQITQSSVVRVTPMIMSKLDTPPSSHRALLDDRNGLLRVHKRELLKALCVCDTQDYDNIAPWSPLKEGEVILRDGFPPYGCSAPSYVNGDKGHFLAMTLTFMAVFDWDLT